MVKGWARDIAYALLSMNWNATIKQMRNEFISNVGNPRKYPQATKSILENQDEAFRAMKTMFGRYCATSDNNTQRDSNELIFQHKDGNPNNKGKWELLWYDSTWDEDFNLPITLEENYKQFGANFVNPNHVRRLMDFEFGDTSGYVYAITNPVWEGWIKIGKAIHVSSRHSSYQTGDPHRVYELIHHKWFQDCGAAETTAHAMLRSQLSSKQCKNEWFEIDLGTVKKIIDSI